MGIINSNFKTVVSFLQEHIYYIPEYQREYSWEQGELEDFWLDLMQLIEEGVENHFLGQVVVHLAKDENKRYIIDGQQRSSTATILLDTFRTKFNKIQKEYGIEDSKFDADDITTKYIGRLTETRNDARIVLGEKDRKFFQNVIQKTNKTEQKDRKKMSKSEIRIDDASQYFNDKLDNYLSEYSNGEVKYSKLKELYDNFINNFNVMYIETDDINEAFIIFETLNARGKDLETSDLLKNYVFRVSSNNIDDVNKQWEKMLDNLGKIDATKFIRHYWNANNKFIREKDLYKKIRNNIDSPKVAKDLVDDLEELSIIYSAIDQPAETIFFDNSELNLALQNVKSLGARSFYPIPIAMVIEAFTEEELLKVILALETLIVRNFVVAGKVANTYEIGFSKVAFNISHNNYKTVDDILIALKKLTLSDDEFKTSFSTFSIKKKNVIRYLYRRFYDVQNLETRVYTNNSKVHIEHIMPQNTKLWSVSEEDHETYLWRFGNLTLLGEEYNKKAINKPFDEKKEVYKKSKIDDTRSLIDYEQWRPEEINQRQKKLAVRALKIWSIK